MTFGIIKERDRKSFSPWRGYDVKRFFFKNRGFTLSEIMVVIIVIGTLASVAAPIIDGIAEQGKVSATKESLQQLRTGLINFSNDLGKLPFMGLSATNAAGYNLADTLALGVDEAHNVLVTNSASGFNCGMNNWTYSRRWKGPYMDTTPEEFMYDAWDGKIRYVHFNKAIYLHSYGGDGEVENPFSEVLKNTYEGDDIVLSISKTKF